MSEVLLISDLHLDRSRPDITDGLVRFLRGRATTARELYILGDLFEVWIGDDAPSELADQVAHELRTLNDHGVPVFLMHGNRDFLIGADYTARCAATLVHEPVIFSLGDNRIALLHGDSLCTGDTDYQKFRRLVRDPVWQTEFLRRSLSEREDYARQARDQSRQATADKSMAIMDVDPGAVEQLFHDLRVDTLIHGHTHRPATHNLEITHNGRALAVQRVVLGDWNTHGWYGAIAQSGAVSLHRFPL